MEEEGPLLPQEVAGKERGPYSSLASPEADAQRPPGDIVSPCPHRLLCMCGGDHTRAKGAYDLSVILAGPRDKGIRRGVQPTCLCPAGVTHMEWVTGKGCSWAGEQGGTLARLGSQPPWKFLFLRKRGGAPGT